MALKKSIRATLIGVGAVVVVALAVWFVRWWVYGRYFQSTNDAYLQADQVIVAPKVVGYVAEVFVAENQQVKAGQPLVRIDARTYESVYSRAQAAIDARKADLLRAQTELDRAQATVERDEAQLANAKAALAFADREVARYGPLAASGADTEERLAKLLNDQEQSRGLLRASTAAALADRRTVDTTKAAIAQAKAQLASAEASAREAQHDVGDTLIRSSIDGRIGDKTVRVGQFVQPGSRLMSVVPTHDLYLRANFKETQIRMMRIGQPATLHVDAMPDVDLHGTVESFSPGTGAQFALLPPENATGNFIKIVQRVPVRIRIDTNSAERDLLLPGLSVAVAVDTRSGREDIERLKRTAKP